MNSGIYIIRNLVTNKVYVGSTKHFDKRWNLEHLKDLRLNKHYNCKLQRSFNKHGEENFSFEIIEELEYDANNPECRKCFVETENYYMELLDSKKNGYNIAEASFGDVLSWHPNKEKILEKRSNTIKERNKNLSEEDYNKIYSTKLGPLNGMFGKHHSEESKKKMSETSLGGNPNFTEEQRKNAAERLRIIASNRDCSGENNSFFGKHHSEESKKKMSESHKGRISPNKDKKMHYSENVLKAISKGGEKRKGGNNGRAKKVLMNEIEYLTIREAFSAQSEYSWKVFRRLLKDENYDNIKFVE